MQKFREELKNIPRNTSLVPCSINLELNKEETPSVSNDLKEDKLTLNNPEVNLPQLQAVDLKDKVLVFVLSISGYPLMPCKPAKARKLLKDKKATVVKRIPFTIQLNFECENQIQEINLGIDTGYGNIGFSATTDEKELICGTLILDGKTKDRLDSRRMYRKIRRQKHHWYRKARFMNRKKKEGWLPPSIQRRYDAHNNLINKLKKILPITNIIVEVAKFDIQKIESPNIQEIEYQQGNLYNYQNMRCYLLARENGKCQLCQKDFKGISSHIHHIKPSSKGGNNRSGNLAILHKSCHEKLHQKGLYNTLKSNARDYKYSTFMNIINKRFQQDITNVKVTYGHITFVNRNKIGLVKTHFNDAFVISGGSNQSRSKYYIINQRRRNNRILQVQRNGEKPRIRKQKYTISSGDLFWIGAKQYVCLGLFNYGRYIYFGKGKREYFKFKDIAKKYKFGSFIWV